MCIAALASGKGDDQFVANLPHEQKALRFLAGDNLRYTVGLQRLLIELSARRSTTQRPQRALAARQIAAEGLGNSTATNVLVQLREQEAALLKLWMLYAPEA